MIWGFLVFLTPKPASSELSVNKGTWTAPVIEAHERSWTKEVIVHAVHVDRIGLVWSGCSDGLRLFAGGSPKRVPLPEDAGGIETPILDLAQSPSKDQIWYLTANGVGWVEADSTRSAFFPLDDLTGRVSLRTFDIDSEGEVWITSTHGLHHLHPDSGEFSQVQDGKEFSRAEETVVDASNPGILWFCSGKSGLVRYNIKSEETSEFFHQDIPEGSDFFDSKVESLCFLSDNEILFGGRNVISRLQISENKIVTDKIQTDHGNRYRRLTSLVPDLQKNGVWVATKGGRGLLFLDLERKSFASFGDQVRFRTTRRGFEINEIAIDRCGVVWMATDSDGLARSAAPTFKVNSFTHAPNNDQSFFKAEVKYLNSHKGELLAQTPRGIASFDPDQRAVRFLTGRKNLEGNSVHTLSLIHI